MVSSSHTPPIPPLFSAPPTTDQGSSKISLSRSLESPQIPGSTYDLPGGDLLGHLMNSHPSRSPGSQRSAIPMGASGIDDPSAPLPSLPMKTLQKQQLEVVAAYQYVLTFLFMGPAFTILIFILLFTRLWSLAFLYLVWLYVDWDTPNRGGRPTRWMRKWAVWKYQRDYFPIKLVKTAELPPDQNYVLGAHPHGIMCTGVFCNFSTDSNGFSQLFPGLWPRVATLAGLFRLPIYRDYLMLNGVCPVSRRSLDFILSQPRLGQAVVILIGGAEEALYAVPGEHCITLQKRKGFVRLALRHGASLVPVYCFGENDIYRLKSFGEGSWQHRWQVAFKRLMGFSPCVFWGRGLFSAHSWGLIPFATPITTVVGRPIPVPRCLLPTEDQVDYYHSLYMTALERLFEDHKESCGVPAETRLTFL